MPWPDLINASFELAGAVPIALSVGRLWRDRAARGIHPLQFGFFALWGMWNLVYYPMLDQWWSLAGGAAIFSANLAWLVSLVVISRQRRFGAHR